MEDNPPDALMDVNPEEVCDEEWMEIDAKWDKGQVSERADWNFICRMEEQYSSFRDMLNQYLEKLNNRSTYGFYAREISNLNRILREGYDEGYLDKRDLENYRTEAKKKVNVRYRGSIEERNALYYIIYEGVEEDVQETEPMPGPRKRVIQSTLTGYGATS